jgi:hypothetical protein
MTLPSKKELLAHIQKEKTERVRLRIKNLRNLAEEIRNAQPMTGDRLILSPAFIEANHYDLQAEDLERDLSLLELYTIVTDNLDKKSIKALFSKELVDRVKSELSKL